MPPIRDTTREASQAALSRSADERRLLLWSAHEAEQQVLAETTLSGHRPITDEDAARFGVYLNDGTGSKLGYYLDVAPQVEWKRCGPDQVTSEATLNLTLTNTVPAEAAVNLPGAIVGGNYGGALTPDRGHGVISVMPLP